jgi:hypothetical protein
LAFFFKTNVLVQILQKKTGGILTQNARKQQEPLSYTNLRGLLTMKQKIGQNQTIPSNNSKYDLVLV